MEIKKTVYLKTVGDFLMRAISESGGVLRGNNDWVKALAISVDEFLSTRSRCTHSSSRGDEKKLYHDLL